MVVAWVLVLRRVLFAVVTDEDWARVAGLPVDAVNIVLAGGTAAVVVVGMRVVGILLIAALTVLPVASAQLLGRSFAQHAAARVRDRRRVGRRRARRRAGAWTWRPEARS